MNSLSDIKDSIKALPISEIVGHFISITKKGQNYEAICPFHSDSHPSLKINDHKGLYKCFACNAGGDAIGFVERIRNVQFVEALKIITEIMGMNVDWDNMNQKKKKDPKFERAYYLMNITNSIYLNTARTHHQEYFTSFLKQRGLTHQIADLFQIGLCPSQNLLSSELKNIPDPQKKDALIKLSQELGLTRQYDSKPMYDFFYNRITFPIHNEFGKVVAYSCRRINEEVEPKYINSRESFIFHKENILYGLYFAKQYIREKDQVILVEGNMDVITLFQYGFNNSVAAMGTSLSKKAIQKMAKMTQNIIFAFDNDTAGKNAMIRSLPFFLEEGVSPRTVDFQESKDADEFLKSKGKIELKTLIDESPTLLHTYLNQLIQGTAEKNSSSELKIQAFEKACEMLSHHKNQILAIEELMNFVKKLGMNSPKEDLIERFKTFKKSQAPVFQENKSTKTSQFSTQTNLISPTSDQEIHPDLEMGEATNQEVHSDETQNLGKTDKDLTLTKLQLKFIGDIILYPYLSKNDKSKQILEIIDQPQVSDLISLVNKTYLECPKEDYINNIQSLLENGQFSNIIKDTVLSSLFNFEDLQLASDRGEKLLDDYGLKLKEEKLILIKKDLIRKQKEAHLEEDAINLLVSINNLNKEILQLRQNKKSINK